MKAIDFRPGMKLHENLHALTREFGLRAIIVALLREALLGPGSAQELARLDHLSDHLREDIGLPPRPAKDLHFAELRGARWPL